MDNQKSANEFIFNYVEKAILDDPIIQKYKNLVMITCQQYPLFKKEIVYLLILKSLLFGVEVEELLVSYLHIFTNATHPPPARVEVEVETSEFEVFEQIDIKKDTEMKIESGKKKAEQPIEKSEEDEKPKNADIYNLNSDSDNDSLPDLEIPTFPYYIQIMNNPKPDFTMGPQPGPSGLSRKPDNSNKKRKRSWSSDDDDPLYFPDISNTSTTTHLGSPNMSSEPSSTLSSDNSQKEGESMSGGIKTPSDEIAVEIDDLIKNLNVDKIKLQSPNKKFKHN